VEIGQLIIVGMAWLVAYWIGKSLLAKNSALLMDMASALLCGLGLYWFVARSYGAA
jgi:hypothetical protein